MDDVVRDGDYESVSEKLRMYIILQLDRVYRERMIVEHLYIELLHAALEHGGDRLDIVARVCLLTAPSGLLCYYVVMYEQISWKIAHALSKVYDLDIELRILDGIDDDSKYEDDFHTRRGRGRLLYLKNNEEFQ